METLADKTHILRFLQMFLEKRALLSIKLGSHSQRFNTVILEINTNDRYIILDALKPDQGNKLLKANPKINIYGQLKGLVIRFDSRINKYGIDNHIPFYRLPIPSTIEYNQRRRAVRVKLGAGIPQPLTIRFTTDDEQELIGEIDDISIAGLRARFSTNIPAHLKRGDHMNCSFMIPPENEERLSCSFIVRVIRHKKTLLRSPFIGGEFVDLPKQIERELQRAIMTLQRAQRQKDNP